LVGLCPRQQTAHDDTYFQGVPTPLRAAYLAARFPAHPLLRLALESQTNPDTAALPRPPTRPLAPKCRPSESPRYGVARTAVGSCISSNRSPPPSSSLPNERSSMPLTPHRTWLSIATACVFPARPLLVCLQAKQSLPQTRFPSVRLHSSPSSAQSRMPSKTVSRYRHSNSLTSPPSQAIQNP
jgi:hypothetical protein